MVSLRIIYIGYTMRHKLISSRWKLVMIIISSIFLILSTVVSGVPLSKSFSNQENVKNEHIAQDKELNDRQVEYSSCTVNGSKYGEGEHVFGAGPCEECICHPPNVICSMMKCPINSGCITIQLPNKCCPKYKCDCEHNGKVYNNGEKINKSDESACRVCFCNGGEIVCTSIVCYTRNDCQGYYLPGDCCPKYDNCSSNPIERKSKDSIGTRTSKAQNIDYWSLSTEYNNYNEDDIWKRDTTEIQKQEMLTTPNTLSISPLFVNPADIPTNTNTTSPNKFGSSISILEQEKNITNSERSTTHNFVTGITEVGKFNIDKNSNKFLDFKTDNLSTNKETIDSSFVTQNGTLEIIFPFEEIFDTSDIDNSVIITHQNGTETIIELTEDPVIIDEVMNSSIGTTTSTQVEIFDPKDLIIDNKRSMIELSTIATEIDVTTEMDDGSREATTTRGFDKSTIGPPHKLTIDKSQTKLDDEINTERTFTDLEDTTDMFGPNFGHQTQDFKDSMESDTADSQTQVINHQTTFLPTILTTFENFREFISEPPLTKSFDQSTNSNIGSIENNTEYNQENISIVINKTNKIDNETSFLNSDTKNNSECIHNNCTHFTKLNDEQSDSQTESTLTTPFIIETKVLPNQVSPPVFKKKKIKYPKEYPEEFETIQYGPSLTITKKTYTSIPDIIYTTTTLITLPTLDLIYKADKEIEKYLANQTTTTKPNNYLSPLRNESSLNST